MLVENAGGGNLNADCMIVPDLVGKSYLRLSKASNELIEAGAQATRECCPKFAKLSRCRFKAYEFSHDI